MAFENTILKVTIKYLIKLRSDNQAIDLKLLFHYKLLKLTFNERKWSNFIFDGLKFLFRVFKVFFRMVNI